MGNVNAQINLDIDFTRSEVTEEIVDPNGNALRSEQSTSDKTLAAKAKGISYFKGLSELNHKESPRLKWGSKILKLMGIKTITTKNSIKIFGNPNLKIKKKIIIKDYLKDHRVFMTSVIAALTFA